MGASFGDRLADAVERKCSQLVVGLDPVPERLPEELRALEPGEAFRRFCSGIVDAVVPYAVAVKPQSAFFEAYAAQGVFREVCAYARRAGLLVIGDAKRGDVPSTAAAYARAFIPLCDAVTVNPYLGRDSLEPFFEACRREGAGIFCLVKTSNPGSADVQDAELSDGRPLWQHVAGLVAEWGEELVGERRLSSVGAVVGATYPRDVVRARELMPRAVLLLPGVGAQGGEPSELAGAFGDEPAGALVSASRSVIYATSGAEWREAAGAEAARLAREVWAVAGAG